MSLDQGKVSLFKKISNMCSNASDPIKEKYPIIKEWGREESFNDGRYFANNVAPAYSHTGQITLFKAEPKKVATVGLNLPEKWKFADGLKNDAQGVAAQDKISQITAANRMLQRFNNPYAAEYVLGRKLTADELLQKSVSGGSTIEQRLLGSQAIPRPVAVAPTQKIPSAYKVENLFDIDLLTFPLPEPSKPSDEIFKLLRPEEKDVFKENIIPNSGKEEAEAKLDDVSSIDPMPYVVSIQDSTEPQELFSLMNELGKQAGFADYEDLYQRMMSVRAIINKTPLEQRANRDYLNNIAKSAGFRNIKEFSSAYSVSRAFAFKMKLLSEQEGPSSSKPTPKKPQKPPKGFKRPKPESESAPSGKDEEIAFSAPAEAISAKVYKRDDLLQMEQGQLKAILFPLLPAGEDRRKYGNASRTTIVRAIEKFGADKGVIVGRGIKKRQRKSALKPSENPMDDIEFAKDRLKVLVGSIQAGDRPNKGLINQLSTIVDFLLFHKAIDKSLATKITKMALMK